MDTGSTILYLYHWEHVTFTREVQRQGKRGLRVAYQLLNAASISFPSPLVNEECGRVNGESKGIKCLCCRSYHQYFLMDFIGV